MIQKSKYQIPSVAEFTMMPLKDPGNVTCEINFVQICHVIKYLEQFTENSAVQIGAKHKMTQSC